MSFRKLLDPNKVFCPSCGKNDPHKVREAFWKEVNRRDEIWERKRSRLPFVKKLAILEELQERTRLLRRAKEISKKN